MDKDNLDLKHVDNGADHVVTKCGYGKWRPQCLQVFNNTKCLLLCIMWAYITQGFITNGVVNVNMSTLERRYDFTTTQVAWISSSHDLIAGIFALLFGYLGIFLHKGLIIAASALIMGIGSLIMVLPHAIGGNYVLGPLPSELCDPEDDGECVERDETYDNYIWFFIAAQCLHGLGGAAVHTLSIPYIDANVLQKDTPLYIGFIQACAIIGPGLGFIIGGILLSIYVDIGRVDMDEIVIKPSDPRWVGAWWIGPSYAVFGAISVSFLMTCFPRELPSGVKYQSEIISESHKGAGEEESKRHDFGKSGKDLLEIMKNLIVNPVWLGVTVGGIVEYMAIIGLSVFLPKIIQFQFGTSPAESAVWAGITIIPASILGYILGGFIPKRLNMKLRGLLISSFVYSGIATGLCLCFLLRCDIPPFAGINVSYDNRTDINDPSLEGSCNAECGCTTYSYDPICGNDGVQYFSPCHAGCLDGDATEKEYFNCSCITESVRDSSALNGVCDQDCPVFPLFLVLFFFLALFTFMTSVVGYSSTIRCMPPKQRTFAFGLQSTIVRFLGSVPGPIILGLIFDSSCWVWQEECDIKGSCWIYNAETVSIGITIMGITLKIVSTIASVLAFIFYKPPPPTLTENDIDISTSTNADGSRLKGSDSIEASVIPIDKHTGEVINSCGTNAIVTQL